MRVAACLRVRACAVLGLAVGLAVLMLPASNAWAAPGDLKRMSQADYVAQMQRLEGLVAACNSSASACDSKAVGDDVRVDAVSSGSYAVRWDWLRAALDKAKDPKLPDRGELLQQAAARLVADRAEAEDTHAPAADGSARAKADAVLRGKEFHRVQEDSYLADKLAILREWIDRLLLGAAILVPQSPWVGVALEWGAVALAAAGLLAWAIRVSKQQRVAIAVGPKAPLGWEQESEDWAARAQVAAGRGEWREAVHCLYWAAIVMLEGQRMWRANRARTPREYVRLLEPGSDRRKALGGLTGVFERIWYGLRPAGETDFRQAESLLAELKAGRG